MEKRYKNLQLLHALLIMSIDVSVAEGGTPRATLTAVVAAVFLNLHRSGGQPPLSPLGFGRLSRALRRHVAGLGRFL